MEFAARNGKMTKDLREVFKVLSSRADCFKEFAVQDYSLALTLDSGQAFRWTRRAEKWVGAVGGRWVRLAAEGNTILAETTQPTSNWSWLEHYLQINVDLDVVTRSFPDEEPMHAAVSACRGLRLLRQDPWECLASFILSSTKQIIQIRQIISLLCERYGQRISTPIGEEATHAFPTASSLAGLRESDLRDCKMGFRAPYLLETARIVAEERMRLDELQKLPVEAARLKLMELPGVGRKIADCVLLFAYGFQSAFPVDVWILKALRQLYFPRRRVKMKKLHGFAASHFGPWGGYAQQYLFHYMRTKGRATNSPVVLRKDFPVTL